MSKTRIAVVRGGVGSGYAASLATGAAVLAHIDRHHYDPVDVLIDSVGTWHVDGVPVFVHDLRTHADVAWVALHTRGEVDHAAHQALEIMGMPYTGPGAFALGLAAHRGRSRDAFAQHNLTLVPGTTIFRDDLSDICIRDIFRSMPLPLLVRSVDGNSNGDEFTVNSFHDLYDALYRIADTDTDPHITLALEGKKAACGIIENFRGDAHYALMPSEVVEQGGISPKQQYLCPGRFSKEEVQRIQNAARIAHKALSARHYSYTTFMVTQKGVYVLDTTVDPDLTEGSLIQSALEAHGCPFSDFLGHILEKVTESRR